MGMKKMTSGILAGLVADELGLCGGYAFSASGRQKVPSACVHRFLEGKAIFFGAEGHEYPLDGY